MNGEGAWRSANLPLALVNRSDSCFAACTKTDESRAKVIGLATSILAET